MRNETDKAFKSAYIYMFNRVSKLVERLESEKISPEIMGCICELKDMQLKAEEIYMEME